MREQIINALLDMLRNNIGQKLTPELATGIATSLNQVASHLEQQPSTDGGKHPTIEE